jgi:hypothetical protein
MHFQAAGFEELTFSLTAVSVFINEVFIARDAGAGCIRRGDIPDRADAMVP